MQTTIKSCKVAIRLAGQIRDGAIETLTPNGHIVRQIEWLAGQIRDGAIET